MIHEVALADENQKCLSQIVRLQLDLLWVAVRLAKAEKPLIRANVLGLLCGLSTGRSRAERLVGWLFDGRIAKPLNLLEEFISSQEASNFVAPGQLLLDEKSDFVEMVRRDVGYLYSHHDGRRGFEFYLVHIGRDTFIPPVALHAAHQFASHNRQGLPRWLKAVKEFLEYFYANLDLPGTFFPNGRAYGRERFFAAYRSTNPTQHICAICDEHRPITVLRGDSYSDIEHYFPKSLYPHLACHPYNLVPICRACNSAHLDRDPLAGADGTRRTLGQVFLPYRSESVRTQGAVKLDWTPPSAPALSIEARQADPAPDFPAKLEAFASIYDIPGRWQSRIHSIGEQLWRQMSSYVRAEMDSGEELTPLKAKTALDRLLGYFVDDLGASPWDYVLVWYLSHLLVKEVEEAITQNKTTAEVPLLVELERIIASPPRQHISRLNVDEVLETSRKLYPAEAAP